MTHRRRGHLVDVLESRLCLHGDFDVTINFQPRTSAVAYASIADLGYAYGDRGGGMNYGWNVDNRANMRDRDKTSDQKLDTLAQMQAGGTFTWELQIPNGQYLVTIGSGDSKYLDGEHHITAEGTMVMYGVQTAKKRYLKATKTIAVNDGRLSLAPGPQGVNTKIQYVRIQSYHETPHDFSTVSISAPVPTAKEGGPDGRFRITRNIVDTPPVSVILEWSGSGGTKKDVVSRPTVVVIPGDSDFVDVPVVAVDDALDEAPETVKVRILASSAYAIGTSTASVTIDGSEDDPEPTPATVSVSTITSQAFEGGSHGVVRFTRSGGTLGAALTLGVSYAGTANEFDLASRPSSIQFDPNQTTLDLTLIAADDGTDEPDETVIVSISPSSSYTVTSGGATVTIVDNDEPTTISAINWSAATAPPISFSETTTAVVNGKLYAFGGFNSVFVPQSKVYRFDGTSWQTMNDSPVAFTHVGHAVVGDKIWFAGGYLGNGSGGQIFGTTSVKIYDTTNDTWSDGPALPQARASGNLVQVGDWLYFFGGENFNRVADTTTMWRVDIDNPQDGWQTMTSMPMARNHASAIAVGTKIYVLGGQTGYDDNLVAHDEIQTYDTQTHQWTVASQKLPAVRSHTVSATLLVRNQIVIIGGESAHNVPVNTVWSINPTTLATTVLGNFPDSRFSTATGFLNGKIYAFGGYAGFIPTTAYVGTIV